MTDQSNRVPWPKIKTPITNNRQLIPLGENYNFSDMSYLDTNEAYPMFEKQADIIIEKKMSRYYRCRMQTRPGVKNTA